jgi:hypothetical protein
VHIAGAERAVVRRPLHITLDQISMPLSACDRTSRTSRSTRRHMISYITQIRREPITDLAHTVVSIRPGPPAAALSDRPGARYRRT